MNSSLHLVPRRQGKPSQQGPLIDLNRMCSDAIRFHQRGQLPEAERIYRRILDHDPHHADSLHLLGVLAHQVGRDDVAVELIRKAIAVDKRPAAYHSNLGTALQALGRMDEAAASYRQALTLNPELAEAQMNLGVVLHAQGKLDEAAARVRRALVLRPNLVEAHVNLGNILQAQGKLEEAAASHEQALALKPNLVEACFNRGNVLQAQGKLEEAVGSYERALALNPDMAELHCNLGNALQAQNRLAEAETSYERALALNPEYADAFYNLGNLRQAQENLNQAAACYERALALKPDLPEAHYNLGNTRQAMGDIEAAAACFERALDLRPGYAEAHYNLACVLQSLGRLEDALPRYQKAVELKQGYAQAHFGLALAQLLHGDFDPGWRNYESRWQSPDHDTPMRDYPQPLWTGEKLSAGRLLLWGEQGVGNEIQFAGLIPDALRIGNRIVLDCDPRLQALFARSFPEIEVVSGCRVAESEMAAHIATGSLPGLFRPSESAFAATTSPYLKADPAETEQFRARYSDGRKLIGLAWQTSNKQTGRKRSIDLALLAPLFAQPGIRWISLQYGDFDALEEQAASASAPLLIDRSVDQFANIDLFAAQIAAMDQVITIDNSTAHLAGALGLPVWLLLPYAADWRWLETRKASPWYPTMRIFRQPKLGDWTSVIECVQLNMQSYTRG
jgi:tetratricopeptide (TPR) repeat protein/ADP-heptose:LPS heptosyltransferase